jgi:CopG family nickel-responsive transcriptional regulator
MPIERISIAIETELLDQLDRWVASRGHRNRSEAMRDLIRARLTAERVEDPDSTAIGSLTLLYDHSQRELADKLVETGHEHHDVVVSSMHVHLDHRMCLEVLALRGRVAELRALADHLGGLKGVEHYELTLGAPELEQEDR